MIGRGRCQGAPCQPRWPGRRGRDARPRLARRASRVCNAMRSFSLVKPVRLQLTSRALQEAETRTAGGAGDSRRRCCVFCPNCGTQNSETASTCTKCGFNLKGAAAPKFKGTMLMNQSPGAPPGGAPGAPRPLAPGMPPPQQLNPGLAGTVVGVPPAGLGMAPSAPGPAAPPPPTGGGYGAPPQQPGGYGAPPQQPGGPTARPAAGGLRPASGQQPGGYGARPPASSRAGTRRPGSPRAASTRSGGTMAIDQMPNFAAPGRRAYGRCAGSSAGRLRRASAAAGWLRPASAAGARGLPSSPGWSPGRRLRRAAGRRLRGPSSRSGLRRSAAAARRLRRAARASSPGGYGAPPADQARLRPAAAGQPVRPAARPEPLRRASRSGAAASASRHPLAAASASLPAVPPARRPWPTWATPWARSWPGPSPRSATP